MAQSTPPSNDRRPLQTRGKAWVNTFTNLLLKTGITPNQISVLSVLFGFLGASAFFYSGHSNWLFLAAAVFIQLRLIANMMDGLVATEGKRGTANGQLYNEVPDRLTDVLFLASAGYATGQPAGIAFGWAASCGALMTAYIRLHGAAITEGAHDFSGPCAKPQRMFLLTVSALLTAIFANPQVLKIGLALIMIGTYYTFARRAVRLSQQLTERAKK
jgi:phosphatidylglycerophosphate synthase